MQRPDQLLLCDCLDGMRGLPEGCIPLTVTSPPFDRVREYGGEHCLLPLEKFKPIAEALYRVTMPGGVVCWHVADGVFEGSLSGTSYRQADYFKEIGFNWDSYLSITTQGWRQPGYRRYANQVSFVWIMSKGRPRVFHPIKDRPNKTAGQRIRRTKRDKDGRCYAETTDRRLGPIGVRGNVWPVATGGFGKTASDLHGHDHPAPMPEELASGLILSWSLPGDLVLDPFGGAATTARMALLNDRRYLSMEIHGPYHEVAVHRMADAHAENRRRLEEALGFFPTASRQKRPRSSPV